MNKLSNKILELQLNLEKLDEQLGFIRSFFSEILNEVVPVEKRLSNSCSICLENKVNEVLVPCGHTFCSQCITRSQNTQTSRSAQKCGICRSHYSQAIKFYI